MPRAGAKPFQRALKEIALLCSLAYRNTWPQSSRLEGAAPDTRIAEICDLVCADEAGVAFVPYAKAAAVLEASRKIDGGDTRRKADIDSGVPLAEILQRKYK